MITVEMINEVLGPVRSRILDYAQMALPESQFRAFRKHILDALGKEGLLSDLERLIAEASHSSEREGTGRHILRKKGGAP